MEKKIIIAILTGLLIIAAMVVWMASQPVGELASGGPHPDYTAMLIGGDGAARASQIILPGYIWQVAVLATVSLMVLLGISQKHRSKSVVGMVGAVFIAMLLVWTSLILAYNASLESGTTDYVLGFPVASAWMIYGVWLAQAGFSILYFFGFRRFIFTHEDEAEFAAIVARKEAREQSGELA